MALQFIFKEAGSAQSDCMYSTIIERSQREKRQFFVIVPEQFTMETQKKLCSLHPMGGIMNIDVQSFVRLAHRIFEETGVPERIFLDDEGKNLILRRVAQNREADLRVLAGRITKTGYISEIKSVISELMQYKVTPQGLREAASSLPAGMLAGKLEDIALLYEDFLREIDVRYTVKEEILERLAGCVGRSFLLAGSVIGLDGFTGFTPVQLRLLGELLAVCETVYVMVDMPAGADPFTYRSPYELFAMSKKMTVELASIARGRGVGLLPSIHVEGQTGDGPQELAFLRENLFRYRRAVYEFETEALTVAHYKDPREEAQAAACAIRRYMRAHPQSMYRHVVVVCTDMAVYGDELERVFSEHDIPCFMDYKKSVLQNGFVESVRALLAMIADGFGYESVFRFLRSGFFPLDEREVDVLENYVLAAGIRGFGRWQKPWEPQKDWPKADDMERINTWRSVFCDTLCETVTALTKRKKTVGQIILALYDYFRKEELLEKLLAMSELFEQKKELLLAKEYGQIGRIVLEVMEKLYELAGDVSISLEDFSELLDAGLAEAKVGAIPPGIDQVLVGDLERTRSSDTRLMLLLGADDTLLPGRLSSDGLLGETDRRKLAGTLVLSPGAGEKLYRQKFYMYLAMGRPSDQLYVFYSRQNAEGKPVRPSYLIKELQRLFPHMTVKKDLFGDMMTTQNALRMLADGIRDRHFSVSDACQEIYGYYAADQKGRQYLAPILAGAFDRRVHAPLSKETARRLYEGRAMSATRMEHFARCAYEHFLTYGLQLAPRRIHEFASLDWGNMAHRAMELFGQMADETGKSWQDLSNEQTDDMIEEAVQRSAKENGPAILFENARNEYMLTLLRRLLHRSIWALTKQLAAGDFHPAAYELSFGQGKIDRVDVSEENDRVYVRVVDYKTGNVGFDIVTFYYGIQLQLPVYMEAAVGWAKGKWPGRTVVPSGLFYYRMKDPIVDRTKDEESEKNLLKELRLDGIVNGREDVSGRMESSPARHSSYIKAQDLPEDAFTCLMGHARRLRSRLSREIMDGQIQAWPYAYQTRTACDYCPYQVICGFDPTFTDMHYHILEKKKTEQMIADMKREEEEERHER